MIRAKEKTAKKDLSKVLATVEAAQSMEQLQAALVGLKPEERSGKPLGFAVQQATERIVAKIVPLL